MIGNMGNLCQDWYAEEYHADRSWRPCRGISYRGAFVQDSVGFLLVLGHELRPARSGYLASFASKLRLNLTLKSASKKAYTSTEEKSDEWRK